MYIYIYIYITPICALLSLLKGVLCLIRLRGFWLAWVRAKRSETESVRLVRELCSIQLTVGTSARLQGVIIVAVLIITMVVKIFRMITVRASACSCLVASQFSPSYIACSATS